MNGERVSLLSTSVHLSPCCSLAVQAGPRPGGRGTFFVRTKKVPKESRPASTPLAAQGVPCAARNIGWLRNSALRASNSPRHRRHAAEPDASVLLGVSEGDRKASTIARCRLLVARMQAAGRNPAGALEHLDTSTPDSALRHPSYEHHTRVAQPMVLTLGPVESAEPRSELGGSARSDDGEDCLSGGRSPARVPQPPDFASSAGKSGTQCLTANAGSPFLGYFFWRSKRSNTPAGGGTPANARVQTITGNREPQLQTRAPHLGPCEAQPKQLATSVCVATSVTLKKPRP
ncbi:hypothetical protein GGR36_003417 [Niveibacterium umoris]|uniref:Uncharacterized protein n=1 Tax=Niveibacterium umoris TaxID=1193620 RepID=A0A840BKI3_9RHOO|nr:hypothetical protein [Niveibacterium umoris]